MGFIPPPLPLTKKQFDKAISEGKTTLFEIDPAFAKWYKSNGLNNKITSVFLAIVIPIVFALIVIIRLNNL
jgi:hypothetical protein